MSDLFNKQAFESLVTKSLLDSLTPEARDQLVARAIENIMKYSDKDLPSFGKLSEEQQARKETIREMDRAMGFAVSQIMRQTLERPENAEKIKAACQSIVDTALRDKLAGNLAEKVAGVIEEGLMKALSFDRY